jgi:hypothetical protein
MDNLEDTIAEAKKWVPFVKRTFNGFDSVKPITIEQQFAESKSRNRLKKSLLDVLTVYTEANLPDAIIRLRLQQVISEWAKQNDEQLCEYLALLYQKKFAMMNYQTTRDKKWLVHFYRKADAIEAFEETYRPAENILKFWKYGL